MRITQRRKHYRSLCVRRAIESNVNDGISVAIRVDARGVGDCERSSVVTARVKV